MVLLLAFITMLIDHIGMIFFPSEDLFRIIGRVSFPLFVWWIVRGYKMTKNKLNYAKRIWILAAISQVPFFFINQDVLFLNVCFTLLFGLFSLSIIENNKLPSYLKVIAIFAIIFLSEYFHFDYGIYGILSVILLYFTWQKKIMSVVFFALLTFLCYWIDYNTMDIYFHLQFYAILAPIILYFTPIQKYDFKINFYLKYWFYPGHLMILYLIYFFIS